MRTYIKSLLSILMIAAGIECTAQADMWVWRNGEPFKVTVADSVTFSEPPTVVCGHEYVDLGLTSGTLWATCNIGAEKPEEVGTFFAWGETEPKENYIPDNYIFYDWSSNNIRKYNYSEDYGEVDDKMTLEDEDDAAFVNWGPAWRMPTHDQFTEMFQATTPKYYADYNGSGVSGVLLTSRINGNTIFLPMAGFYYYIQQSTDYLYYGTSSLGNEYPLEVFAGFARVSSQVCVGDELVYRYYGLPIRPVLRDKKPYVYR